MMTPHIGDIYAKVANTNLSSEEAHEMIEAACEAAASQIRAECWRRWQAEHDHQAHQRVVKAEQEANATNSAAELARANAGAEARQADLRAAENKPRNRF